MLYLEGNLNAEVSPDEIQCACRTGAKRDGAVWERRKLRKQEEGECRFCKGNTKQTSKLFCVIHVASKNNNNREINAANKKWLRKCYMQWSDWDRIVCIPSTLLYFAINLKYANQEKWEKKCQIKLVLTLDVWAVKYHRQANEMRYHLQVVIDFLPFNIH